MTPGSLKIVLVTPEIPGNTGSIGRTCVALDMELCLIQPYGFDLSEKAVRRAGLDYWKHVRLKEFTSFEEFLFKEKPSLEQLFFFSRFAEKSYFDASFQSESYLIFGSETKGLPKSFLNSYQKQMYHLPMFSENIRSLNLSNVATAVAYEAIRQVKF